MSIFKETLVVFVILHPDFQKLYAVGVVFDGAEEVARWRRHRSHHFGCDVTHYIIYHHYLLRVLI